MPDLSLVVEPAAIFLSVLALAAIGPPLSGLIYMLFAIPTRLPVLGPIYRFLISGPVKLVFPVKVACWLLGGTLQLLPVLAVEKLGSFAAWQSWAMTLAGVIVIFNEMHRVVLFQTPDYTPRRVLPSSMHYMIPDDSETLQKLSRAHFVDMTVVGAIKVIAAFAIVMCGLSHIVPGAEQVSILRAFAETVAQLGLAGDPEISLPGWVGDAFAVTLAVSGIVFLVFFVSLASGLIDRDMK